MEWIIALGLTIVLAVALPGAIVATKRRIRGNRRMAGVALSIGLAFSILFDPRKPEKIEHVAKRESESEDREEQSEP